MLSAPISVIEFAGFRRRADELLTADERETVINAIAYAPLAGDVIPGTGGMRKIRVGREGVGKRGGARAIYYFYNEAFPILLLALYAKNEKVDLSAREKRLFTRLVEDIVAAWKKQ